MIDTDKGGTIDYEELALVLRKLGSDPSEDELNALIKQVDADGNGVIDFQEYLQLLLILKNDGIPSLFKDVLADVIDVVPDDFDPNKMIPSLKFDFVSMT